MGQDHAWFTRLPLHLRAALAGGDEPDPCEDEQDGEDFYEAEGVEAEVDGGGDRADYTLLMSEARYKCRLSVAGDMAVSEATDYYRRKGPDSKLARALMMQGAVLSERGDSEGAMKAYKEAEPVADRVGTQSRSAC